MMCKGGDYVSELFGDFSNNLIDLLIYGAVAVCLALGLAKCVFPLRRAAGLFRRAIRSLALYKPNDATRPIWQEGLFLGKPMQKQWTRFLVNAEQLDQRGLSCDVEEYINDENVLQDFANFQLAEVIPGLLTSLGILGTFIGLMRGLGNLNLSSADNTVSSIHNMISGMTFAYGTSIAGLTASLLFNVFFRASQGAATNAMDDFNQAFQDVIMRRPLDEPVRHTCYMEDQASFLSNAVVDINQRIENGITSALERSFFPISQSMQNFIFHETQTQVEGLNHIVNEFVSNMNNALDGQFLQLGKTLSQLNQTQTISLESITQTMNAANVILENIQSTSQVSNIVMERFDSYVASLSQSQHSNALLAEQTAQALRGIHQSITYQNEYNQALVNAQADLGKQMEQYANWSGRVLEAVEKQSDISSDRVHEIANEMNRSGKMLQDSYGSFVENISIGLSRTMGLFEENMRDITQTMLTNIANSQNANSASPDFKQFNQVQQALSDMTTALNNATKAVLQMAEGA